jgi:hypothetical protein
LMRDTVTEAITASGHVTVDDGYHRGYRCESTRHLLRPVV